MIKIREHELDIDVLEEMNYYDWDRARNRGEELTACSPFRTESSPSFSINLVNGTWIDFGANDDYHSKGNIVTLLSYLRQENPSQIEDYLIDKYGLDLLNVENLSLNVDFTLVDKPLRVISKEEYSEYAFRSPYLGNRGITEKVQRAFQIGYNKKANAVAFAWHDIKGNIVNVKFRSVKSKIFFYFSDGQPIRNHIYGMHFVYRLKSETVFIVESEIDALYLWSNGYHAIALGGSNLSEPQKQLLLRCPAKTFVIATDNDSVGQEVKKKIIDAVIGYKELKEIHLPDNTKDVNDLSADKLKAVADNATTIEIDIF